MSLFIANIEISDLKLGNVSINEVWLGNEKVWPVGGEYDCNYKLLTEDGRGIYGPVNGSPLSDEKIIQVDGPHDN